jgi:hypothetical protein
MKMCHTDIYRAQAGTGSTWVVINILTILFMGMRQQSLPYEDIRNAHKIDVETFEGKRSLGKIMRRENGIKMGLQKSVCRDVN